MSKFRAVLMAAAVVISIIGLTTTPASAQDGNTSQCCGMPPGHP
jgi:hypothetical protein